MAVQEQAPDPKPKRKTKDSPTKRAIAEARKRGWIACVVEKWIPHTKRRLDAFGFGDILAVDPEATGAILIQATTGEGGAMAQRRTKILETCTENAAAWLKAGNRIVVWGWAKRVRDGKRGNPKVWVRREMEITLDELDEHVRKLDEADAAVAEAF